MVNMTEFTVTPKLLLQSVEKMEASVKKAKMPVSNWEESAKEMEKYMKGKTGEAFRKEAALIAKEWQQQIEKLSGITAQLKEIADTYKAAEGENLDVIYRTAD